MIETTHAFDVEATYKGTHVELDGLLSHGKTADDAAQLLRRALGEDGYTDVELRPHVVAHADIQSEPEEAA